MSGPPDPIVVINVIGALATPLLLARVCRQVIALNARAGAALENAKSCPAPPMTEDPPA